MTQPRSKEEGNHNAETASPSSDEGAGCYAQVAIHLIDFAEQQPAVFMYTAFPTLVVITLLIWVLYLAGIASPMNSLKNAFTARRQNGTTRQEEDR